MAKRRVTFRKRALHPGTSWPVRGIIMNRILDLCSRATLACSLGCIASACTEADDGRTPSTDGDAGNGAVVVRDSAGIAIIANPADSNIVALEEALRIGMAEGDPAYELYRVGDVAIGPRGDLYVASANGIRVFDQQGRFVRRFGAAGKGPGEFGLTPRLWFAGDTVLAVDRNLMRTTAFDTAGRVLHTYNANVQPELTIQPWAANARSWIATVERAAGAREGIRADRGVRVDLPPRVLMEFFPASETLGDTLFRVPRAPVFGAPGVEGGVASQLFVADPAYAFDGAGGLYRTTPGDYRVDVYSPNGAWRRSVRREFRPLPITDEDLAELAEVLVEAWLAGITLARQTPDQYRRDQLPRQRERIERSTRDVPLPAMRSPIGAIRVSRGGVFAVERTDYLSAAVVHARRTAGGLTPATRWDLFRPDGRYWATVALPADFRLYDVDDYGTLTGVLRDEDGVEYVVRYALAER
jgi:hypothetical protein